jgi:hypothetical protein
LGRSGGAASRLRLRRHPAAQPDALPPAHRTPGCVGDHLRPVTGGTYDSRCQRLGSPPSSTEVPAATQEGPAGTGRAGDTTEDRCSGVRPLEVPVKERGRPPPRPVGISDQARSVTAGAGLAFRGRLAGAPRPLPAAGMPDLGTARRVNPEPKDPKGRSTRLDGPGTSRLATANPGVDGCHVPAAGGAVRLRATVSTDAGTRVRMMRTRSARPRAIRSASPVRSWPTASCRRGALARMVIVCRPSAPRRRLARPLGHPLGPGEGGQFRGLGGAEQQDG